MLFITNNRNYSKKNSIRINDFYVNIEGGNFIEITNNSFIYYEGDISPREGITSNTTIAPFLINQFLDHGKNFIHNIKGEFTLLVVAKNGFHVFSDRFGIKKHFHWYNENHFIISTDLSLISSIFGKNPLKENIALYTLTYHFISDKTVFDNIYHSKPAEEIEYITPNIDIHQYWYPNVFLTNERKDITIEEISFFLRDSISSGLSDVDRDSISLSLTGGSDTRNLLSLFLALDRSPHVYTYGNSESADCIKAKSISDSLGLDHSIHDISVNSERFQQYARKIVKLGNSLASIHRAHRLIAVELERPFAKNMFLGTLGGEFIRGVSEDNYIIPSIVYENWTSQELTEESISKTLKEKEILVNNIDLLSIKDALSKEPYFIGSPTERKLNSLVYLTAHLHDAQDLNLYMTAMDKVITPFLDIDYLELIFSSEHSFIEKEKKKNSFLKRISNPIYASKFLKVTYPALLDFEYSGEHIPREVLFNKYYAAATKYVRQKTRPQYPQNFPLGQWMVDFVKQELPTCNDYSILKDVFNLESLNDQLEHNSHKTNEAYWLKFTNPIMMKYILDEYAN